MCLAGDPLYDAHGTTAQEAGSFNVHLQARGWSKESGLLPHDDLPAAVRSRRHTGSHGPPPGTGTGTTDTAATHADDGTEFNESQQIDLFLSYTPIDRLTLTLDLPWRFNEITETEGGVSETSSLNGFGDMSLAATGVVWRNRSILPSTWVEGRAFVKFPTGQSRQEVDGKRDPHLQPGTGSWDFGFGTALVHKLDWAYVYASASYRVNTKGSLDYEYGDVFLFNAAMDVPVGHAFRVPSLEWLTASLQLNFRWADFDRARGELWADSGGSIPYLTPGVAVRLPWFPGKRGPSLRGFVQLPLTQAGLNGRQHEDLLWGVGLQYGF